MYFTVWWKGPGSIPDFACSDPATAVSFKLIRQKSQLYRKQQHKITIVVQSTAEKSSLLSIQMHFLKLFVQLESADGSCTQSSKYWRIIRWWHASIYVPGILDLLQQLHFVPSLSENILVSNSQKKSIGGDNNILHLKFLHNKIPSSFLLWYENFIQVRKFYSSWKRLVIKSLLKTLQKFYSFFSHDIRDSCTNHQH